MHHGTPVELRQFAGQGYVGDQATAPTFQAAIKSAQRLVHRPAHAAGDHAENSPGTIARTFLIAAPFAALPTAGRDAQPRGEVLFRPPVLRQVRARLGHQLQQRVVGDAGNRRRIFAAAQPA